MDRKKTLEDYYLPDVVNTVLEGELTLSALIPEQSNQYFLPISVTIVEDIPGRFGDKKGNVEKIYLAKPGKYEICDIGYVIKQLEKINKFDTNPDSLGRKRPLKKIVSRQLMSSGGEKGCLVLKKWNGYLGSHDYRFTSIPFTRILVQQAKHPQGQHEDIRPKKRDEVGSLIDAYLEECDTQNKSPKLNDLWRYLKKQPTIDVHQDGQLLYPTYGGTKTKSLTKSQLSDRLSRALKKN
jgi:hypothetical protein